jgi:ribosomal protein S18 acetylase RimI-like enzyme
MIIRTFTPDDEQQVIDLWQECGLVVAWNDPHTDIQRKLKDSPELFFVGEIKDRIAASCLAGYDGHRGWMYYLAVRPKLRKQGLGSRMVRHAEQALLDLGCLKINIMVRDSNQSVISFYHRIGFEDDPVVVLGKTMIEGGSSN